jgi:hypothetical protein
LVEGYDKGLTPTSVLPLLCEPHHYRDCQSMTTLAHVAVDESSPLTGSLVPISDPPIDVADGEVLIHLTKFIITATATNYSIIGKMPGLEPFSHFPPGTAHFSPPAGKVLCPLHGTGVVTLSRCPGVNVGDRLLGFLPLSPWCKLRPTQVREGKSFMDGVPHREKLMKAYTAYEIIPKPANEDEEDLRAQDGNLFGTGFAIAHQAEIVGAQQLLITSASARTSQGAAFAAKRSGLPLAVVGLTSAGNKAFVHGTGLYDQVYSYDEIPTMPTGSKVAVFDIAGSPSVTKNLRERLQSDIICFQSVGVTAVDEVWKKTATAMGATAGAAGGGTEIDPNTGEMRDKRIQTGLYGGAKTEPFTVWNTLKLIVGGEKSRFVSNEEMRKQMGALKEAYVQWKLPTFKTRRHYGAEATLQVWNKACANQLDPNVTDVCSLWPSPELTEPKLQSRL